MPIDLHGARRIRNLGQDEFIICEQKYVKVIENDGKMKWFYTDKGLQNLAYIESDPKRNIYACDLNMGYVYQISTYTYYISRIIAYGIGKPSSVIFNPTNRTLVMGA